MVAIRSLKPKETYETFINNLVHFGTPSKDGESIFMEIINDTVREKSLKEGTRNERGHGGYRIHFKRVQHYMLHGMRWQKFLYSNANKDLITLVANYLHMYVYVYIYIYIMEGERSKLSCPFILLQQKRQLK